MLRIKINFMQKLNVLHDSTVQFNYLGCNWILNALKISVNLHSGVT